MYYPSQLLIALIFMTSLSMGACRKAKESETSPLSQSQQTSPLEALLSSEKGLDSRVETTNIFEEHLEQARKSFIENDMTRSALEINQAGMLLEQKYDFSTPIEQANIKAVVEDLSTISALVNDGKIKSVQELELVFAQAYLVSLQIFIDGYCL